VCVIINYEFRKVQKELAVTHFKALGLLPLKQFMTASITLLGLSVRL